MEKHDGSQGWWIDNVSFGSNLRFTMDSGATHVEFTALSINTFDAFRWTHFTVTREGLTYRLYVNGEEVASTVTGGDLDLSNGAPLYLGSNQSMTGDVGG